MASQQAEAAILAYVQSAYTAAVGTFPYVDLLNQDANLRDATLQNFYSLTFVPVGTEKQIGFGNPGANRFEEFSSFQVHFFVRSGTGSALAKSEAEKVRNALRAKLFSGVIIEDVGQAEGGPGDDTGAWYAVTVSVDFRYSTYH